MCHDDVDNSDANATTAAAVAGVAAICVKTTFVCLAKAG